MKSQVGAAATLALWGAVIATIAVTAPPTSRLLDGRTRLGSLDTDGAAALAAEVGLCALACWLAAGLLAGAATAVPGRLGHLAARAHAALLPAVLRRALAGGAGLGIVLAPLAPALASAESPAVHATTTTAHQTGSTDQRTPRPSPAPTPLPPPTWPTTPTAPTTPAPPTTPVPPTSGPAQRPGDTHGSADGGPRATVTRGDSLWVIAAHRLGPQASDAELAAYWPAVYRRNAGVIGTDPNLIQPGQSLNLPDPH